MRSVLDQPDLVARLRDGDEGAFAELMRAEGPRLLRVARRLMRTEEDARDCFQETMLKISKQIGGFAGRSSLRTWMYRITVNTCLMKLRKTSSKAEAFIDDLMPTFDARRCRIGEKGSPPSPESLLERRRTKEIVREAIEELPDPFRAVLILRDIEEMPANDVADALSIKASLVHVRLHRARAALKKLLEPTLFDVQEEPA